MNLLESKPDGFRAGLAIAFAAEEAAQLLDQAKHRSATYTNRVRGRPGAVSAIR